MRALWTALALLAPLAARAQVTAAEAARQYAQSAPEPQPAISPVTPVATPATAAPAPATGPTSPTPEATPAAPTAASGGPQASPSFPDDFDLLPKEKLPDAAGQARAAEIERKIGLRRKLLQLHQLGGFLTLGALTLTVVSGQLNYQDKYGGGGDTARFRQLHLLSSYGAAAIFATTGLLAILAPNPTDKPVRLDTATLHKIFLAIATAAMVSEVVLGPLTGSAEGTLRQRDLALAHQIIGYTALASTAAGFFVLTF